MAPKDEWLWDSANRRWVQFVSKEGRWIDEKYKFISTPPEGLQAASSSSGGSRAAAGKPQQASRPSFDTEPLRRTLPSLDEGQASATRQDDRRTSDRTQDSSGQRTYTARDQSTGVVTPWEVVSKGKYTNPQDKSQTASFSLKRIGKDDRREGQTARGMQTTRFGKIVNADFVSGRKISKRPDEDYREGNVIQFRFVPPPNAEFSALSAFTQSSTPSNAQPPLTRIRRFIVIKNRPDGRASFRAVAIKTYNGDGVGQHGVIKSHHSQCYTGRDSDPVPRIRSREHPRRLGNGEFESGMQPRAIRIKPDDRTWKLDDMSRIHYTDEWEFDHQAENIKVFGEVREGSRAAFFLQYQHVWQIIRAASRGPNPLPNPLPDARGSQDEGSGTHRGPPSTTNTVRTALLHEHDERPPPGTTAMDRQRRPSVQTQADGAISVEHMRRILHNLQVRARELGQPVPAQNISTQELEGLAQSEVHRQRYLGRIAAHLRQARDAAGEESGSTEVSDSGTASDSD